MDEYIFLGGAYYILGQTGQRDIKTVSCFLKFHHPQSALSDNRPRTVDLLIVLLALNWHWTDLLGPWTVDRGPWTNMNNNTKPIKALLDFTHLQNLMLDLLSLTTPPHTALLAVAYPK